MTPGEEEASYAGWPVAREVLAQQRARGHIIAGLLPTTRPLGVRALCVQCGAEMEVLFGQGRSPGSPRVQGRMQERACGPGTWWEASDRDERLAPLAFLARAQPGFVGHALAAYRHTQGTALKSGQDMAAWLQTTEGALQRLELYPLPPTRPGDRNPTLQRMAWDTRASADQLGLALAAATSALAAEAQQALVAAGQAEIAQARAAVVAAEKAALRARAHLDELLGLATTPAAEGR